MFWTRRQVETVILIGIGAMIGANLRYFVSGWAAGAFGTTFPWGTTFINFTGSVILAIFTGYAGKHATLDPRVRLLVAVGFCGGYTTFSTYATESMTLLQAGDWIGGLMDILGSNLICLVGVAIGLLLGSRL